MQEGLDLRRVIEIFTVNTKISGLFVFGWSKESKSDGVSTKVVRVGGVEGNSSVY